MRAVALKTTNRDNQGEYFTGLASVFPNTCSANDDIFTPLGDPTEASIAVALDFLAHFGLIEREAREVAPPAQRFELLQTWVVQDPSFRFTRPLSGFETFDEGELIATDGAQEIRAPCRRCTVLMPTREPIVGREGVYLARPLD